MRSSNFARAQEQEASSKAKAEGDVKKAMGAAEMQVLEAEKNAEKVKESLGQKSAKLFFFNRGISGTGLFR